jgi:cytoskeletal protein RodZ
MLKRVFWLLLIGAGGWLLWRWWRQRQEEFSAQTPYLARLEPRPQPAPAAPAPTPPMPASTPPVPPSTPEPASTPSVSTPAPKPAASAAPPASSARQEPAAAQGADAVEAASNGLGAIIAYCPRCKAKRPVNHPHQETTESGRRAARGTCPVCGGNIFTFLPNK